MADVKSGRIFWASTIIFCATFFSLASADEPATPHFTQKDSSFAANWLIFLSSWGKYLDSPTTEHAYAAYKIMPSHINDSLSDDMRGFIVDSLYQHFDVVEQHVWVGDRNAVKLAFKSYVIADGDFAEWVDIILGKLIRINPKLFLEELQLHYDLVSIESLVGNFGYDFPDVDSLTIQEKNLRINALKNVTDSALIPLREQCIAALKEE